MSVSDTDPKGAVALRSSPDSRYYIEVMMGLNVSKRSE